MNSVAEQLKRDTAFGFFDARIAADQLFHPRLIANAGANTMLKAVRDELRRSNAFIFSVAFITPSAIALLKQALIDFNGRGTIITSTYLGFNSPAAFKELANLAGIDVYVYPAQTGGFHPKGYIFEQAETTTAIIGSSNLTEYALLRNQEWNLRFSALPDGDIVEQLHHAVAVQKDASAPLTAQWIAAYAATYVDRSAGNPDALAALPLADIPSREEIRPNAMQREALAEIQKVRDAGETRALVISATGTGKTILAALDVRAVDPARVLFVVHREQILDRAMSEFARVLHAPETAFGKFVGAMRQLDRRYVFATVQSLSRTDHLEHIDPTSFDYVIVDEVHRAGAPTYRRILDHLSPRFLLGMTATPERTDEFDVFALFDHNVPYEIRLQKALEADMLAPFHYYGVTDFVTDTGDVIDDATQLHRLVAPERVDHVLRAISRYGHAGTPVRGLVFCSRKDEARELAALLNTRTLHNRKLRTRALVGDDSIEERERTVAMLEQGELDYILTVDIFNEGIDIPAINQVVMLRQTQSSIVFTQQLGRGLRKAAGKDHLVVIDFIGNYANNHLIPIALFGDSSLSKESIRKRMIEAQDAGVISGLSSVNFDAISRERVFQALAAASLDSMANLKKAFTDLEARMGRPPRLVDFARYDTVDPNIIATKRRNYWTFLHKLKRVDEAPSTVADGILTFLSMELLNGKRPHELLLLQALIAGESVTRASYADALYRAGCTSDRATIESVERMLSLEFMTEVEARRYRDTPLVTRAGGAYALSAAFCEQWERSSRFQEHVRDVIETGLFIARHTYGWTAGLVTGRRYSRKDVCRLLNWRSNQQGTIYGYKVDTYSGTCPIFVKYQKGDEVSASTRYEDAFIDPGTLHWYTSNNRTLRSREVQTILENRTPLHLFAKKNDAEGTDFFYLGTVTSRNARQEHMSDGKDVVSMALDLDSPVETGLYDYFTAQA